MVSMYVLKIAKFSIVSEVFVLCVLGTHLNGTKLFIKLRLVMC